MYDDLIEAQVIAVRIACGRLTALGLKTLQDSVEQACSLPAAFGWERKAAAHAEIFNVLADAADDLVVAPVLRSGVGLSHDLMIAAGRCAEGMIASSRKCWLACLGAGDVEGAVAEMEKLLRVLNCMYRIASPRETRWGRVNATCQRRQACWDRSMTIRASSMRDPVLSLRKVCRR